MKNSVPPPFARLREKEGVLDFINSLRSYKIGTLNTPSFTPDCFKNYATKLPVLFFSDWRNYFSPFNLAAKLMFCRKVVC